MNQAADSMLSSRLVVAFDGDDTLWRDGFDEQDWERRFKHLAADRLPFPGMAERFKRLLDVHGYTIGGVRDALLESARQTSSDDLPPDWLEQVDALPDLCASLEIAPSPHIEHVEALGRSGREIWIVTKGDLVRQAIKLARFGRAHRFARIEMVPRKNKAAYRSILKNASVDPRRFTMVGDSLAEDVIPVLRTGASAVHVPAGRWTLLRPIEHLLPSGRGRVSANLAEACRTCKSAMPAR